MWPKNKKAPRVCIIGAGPSGLATARRLLEAGIHDISIFDRQSAAGGNWTWGDPAAHSSIYETVRSISSRDMTSFEGVPFSAAVGSYPTRADMLHYLRSFAIRFHLLPHIRFDTQVSSVGPMADGGWLVQREGERPERFDAVCVCSGHHWDPAYPSLPGDFSGRIVHVHEYRQSARFAGERVLVIGCGNSGADIAVDLARAGCSVFLSLRRGYHIVPRFLFGVPSDVLYSRLRRWVPDPLLRRLSELLLTAHRRYLVGDRFPLPDHRLFATHPLINSELLPAVRDGAVKVVGPVEAIHGPFVSFAPTQSKSAKCPPQTQIDTIVACTGYRVSFPFLDAAITGETTEELLDRLRLRLVHSHHTGLYFVGLLQPSGSLWPVADAQAKFVAAHLLGTAKLPPGELPATKRTSRYVPSPRHLLEVNGEDYERTLLDMASISPHHQSRTAQ